MRLPFPNHGLLDLRIVADHRAPPSVTKEDILEHFKSHGAGNITEVKLMNGFGFIEYDDAMDARDVVPGNPTLIPSFCSRSLILRSIPSELPYPIPLHFP